MTVPFLAQVHARTPDNMLQRAPDISGDLRAAVHRARERGIGAALNEGGADAGIAVANRHGHLDRAEQLRAGEQRKQVAGADRADRIKKTIGGIAVGALTSGDEAYIRRAWDEVRRRAPGDMAPYEAMGPRDALMLFASEAGLAGDIAGHRDRMADNARADASLGVQREQLAYNRERSAAAEARAEAEHRATIADREARVADRTADNARADQALDLQREKLALARERRPTLTPADRREIFETDEQIEANTGAIAQFDRAIELNKSAYSGILPETRGAIGAQFGIEGAENTLELNNVVIGNALAMLRTAFGGNPTEGEREILVKIQGSLDQPPAVRRKIFEEARAAAVKRLRFNQAKAQALRDGSYYSPEWAGRTPDAGAETPDLYAGAETPDLSGASDDELLRMLTGQ